MGMSESLASCVRPTFDDDARAASLAHSSGTRLLCPYDSRQSHCSTRPTPVSRFATLRPRPISALPSSTLSLASNACPHPSRCRQRYMSAGKEGAARASSVRALDGGRSIRGMSGGSSEFPKTSSLALLRCDCYTVAEPRTQCGAQR